MKKRNLLLLTLVCIISLIAFTGLLVYAFQLQSRKDIQNQGDIQAPVTEENVDENAVTPTALPTPGSDTIDSDAAELTPTASPTAAADPNSSSEDTQNTATSTPADPNLEYSSLPASSDKATNSPIVLGFAGDVNLDEDSDPSHKYDAVNKDITKCFSDDLLNEMSSSDIMMLNNEFAYSTKGTEEQDKSYTFRANPSRVEILEKMGVDIVSLANNHALDFGPDALTDTFDTLDGAGIEYAGAGNNLDRAKAPIYYKVGNKTIAYVAASRVVFAMDWYASENGLGMIGTYDPTMILESIKEAKANSDYVVIFVHWGVERNSHPENYERTMAKQYIESGADAVIGCHPHVMQGIEFYQGKPIAYSLGNFWFNDSTKESGMIKLYLDPDNSVRVQILPAMNKDTFTYLLEDDADKKSYYDFIQGLSYQVNIDEDGFITEVK